MTKLKQKKVSLAGVLSLTVLLAAVAGCGPKKGGEEGAAKGGEAKGGPAASQPANAPTPVTVAAATEELVTRTIPVNGNITALQSVSLSPKVSARIISVLGREGDPVQAGQVVVQQDVSDLQQQLEQAQANLQSAQAKLTQARTNLRIQEATSSVGVANAQAALRGSQAALRAAQATQRAAQANVSLAKNPQRTEQITQAELAVEQAQANYDRAVADRKRYEYLVKEGAAAQATLDQYVTTEKVQKANLDTAKQSLKIAQTGGRQESVLASQEQNRQAEAQVRQAEAQVRQSEAQVRQARANVQQNLARQDDIRAAQATVAQNQAAVDLARQQIADASIRSPINGIIATRATEPGQQAAPGASVMTVVALGTVYFQAQVPETDIVDVQRGRTVTVRADAIPGKTFTGKVADLFPTASTSSRAFSVRVNVPNSGRLLRPGMFARGQVVAEQRKGVVISKDALIADGEQFAVYVVENNKAVRRPVKLGIQTAETAEVLSGVRVGEQVIIQGQTLVKDGGSVSVKQNDSAIENAASARQEARR